MTSEGSIAAQIGAVRSIEGLHTLLSDLAAESRTRWTRTQVLYYLPEAFHGPAHDYFQGERLVVPSRAPVPLTTVEPIDLTSALHALASRTDAERGHVPSSEDMPRPRVPLLSDLKVSDDDQDGVVSKVLRALVEEARVVDREMPKRFRLTNGRCVGPQGERYVYVFSWSSEPDLFVPGELHFDGQIYGARVGQQGDGDKSFELLVETFLGSRIDRAIFRIDPTFLLRVQFELLSAKRDIVEDGQELVSQLFRSPGSLPSKHDSDFGARHSRRLNENQRNALSVARRAAVGYVWGPPGTGKTTTLGSLIRSLVDAGDRVLVLSPYNVAVDQAVEAAYASGELAAGRLIRFGRVSESVQDRGLDLESLLEEVARNNGLLAATRQLYATVLRQTNQPLSPPPATVRKCLHELGAIVVQSHGMSSGSSRQILEALKLVRAKFRAPERELMKRASVIGTTVSLALLSSLVSSQLFDHILVDEASVVRVPEALLVALSGARRVTFFGDPKQLPPIVRNRSDLTDEWLRRNPFDLAGIQRPQDAQGSCVMLREQHRMAPPIRQLVSDLFYEGALSDGQSPPSGRVLLLDSSDTPARTTTRWIRMSRSKENLIHRGIVASLIRYLRERGNDDSILVLSPYLAQKRAYDAEASSSRVPGVHFRTVHSSQGSERDIVIIDLVLAPGRGKSRFMNERVTPEFRNLLNVAMSRAKRQLIVLGHSQYIRDQYPGGLLDVLLGRIREQFECARIPDDLRLHTTWATIN